MKRMMLAAVVPLLVASGCSATFGASATCTSSGDCSFSGEIKGTMVNSTPSMPASQVRRWAVAKEVFDAADITIGLDGSTVAVPQDGYVTLSLTDSRNGVVQAAQVFAWTRSGNTIQLADPDAVNAWAMAQGGSADVLAFQAHPFAVQAAAGSNTLRVTSQFQGEARASGSYSWTSLPGTCGRHARCQAQ